MEGDNMKDSRAGGLYSQRNRNWIIDLLMTVILLLLAAYSLIGETFHEVAGTVMLVLFLTHTWLHRKWWKAIPKGRYTLYRGFVTVLDMVLLVLMLLQPLSGIAMSHHLYTFLDLNVSAAARDIHLFLAYWCYVLMSFHLGLHMGTITRAIRHGKDERPAIQWAGRILLLGISVYGIYAFIHRGLPDYMFKRSMFAFFDFSEPLLSFFADYLAIMILFITAGHYFGKLMQMPGRKSFQHGNEQSGKRAE